LYLLESVCLVLPTYREKETIRQTILDFQKLNVIDQIIVVNNNAEIGTSEQLIGLHVIEIHEKKQGYGAAIKAGIKNSNHDLIVVCEPDGTFVPADLNKLLPFTDKCDLVLGSRTVSNYIWTGANMNYFLRFGNWSVAKLVELLFNGPSMSDVGCTFRILRREFAKKTTDDRFSEDGTYGLEQQVFCLKLGLSLVQVPVNYLARIGESTYSGSFRKVVRLGLSMILRILLMRLGFLRAQR
jgi:glycosyltransferase involved in cell wall biosynthesis